MRALRIEVIGPALLEMRTASQKQYDPILLLQSVFLKIMSGFLYFAVCKQVLVPIHFTGLPNELREIIGSLQMLTKRSNAATPVLVPPKTMKINFKKWSYDKMLIN